MLGNFCVIFLSPPTHYTFTQWIKVSFTTKRNDCYEAYHLTEKQQSCTTTYLFSLSCSLYQALSLSLSLCPSGELPHVVAMTGVWLKAQWMLHRRDFHSRTHFISSYQQEQGGAKAKCCVDWDRAACGRWNVVKESIDYTCQLGLA